MRGIMKTISSAYLVIISLCLLTCDLPHQPGPMPTDIIETTFEPGLNIMGVLRGDNERGSSFININRALTTEEIYADSIPNFSPPVNHVKVTAQGSGTEFLFLRGEDSSDWANYQDTTLTALPGEIYDLEIEAPGFPTLTGTTMVPLQPKVVSNSIQVGSRQLSFQIQHHPSAFEYRMYLFFPGGVLEKTVKPNGDARLEIDWSFDESFGVPMLLGLAAQDENLTRYGNSPISFIPNTYHPEGSTVTGGYGCFGSVSVSFIVL